MNKNLINFILIRFIILLLRDINVSGQPVNLKFESTSELKNQNFVNAIYRDSKGYLWLGSGDGLARYDGSQIVYFRHDKAIPSSISPDYIICIEEDSLGNIWIGTDYGLNLYNRNFDSFQTFKLIGDKKDSRDSSVNCVITNNKGNLWIGTNFGLRRYDYKSNRFVRYTNKHGNLLENEIRSIVQDSKGTIWLVTLGSKLWQFDPATEEFTPYSDPDIPICEGCYKKILIDKTNIIWIGTRGGGLLSFNPQTGKFRQYSTTGDGTGTNGNMIYDIIDENEKFLLVGCNPGGINRLNKTTDSFQYITEDNKNEYGLTHPGIYSFYKDTEGIIWVATARGGVLFYNPKKYKFEVYRHSDTNPNSLIHNIVGCFLEDSEGLIWIGTDGGGISVYNKKNNKFRHFIHDPENPNSLSGNFVRSIKEDKDHNIWIGTWNEGLNRYDKKTGRFHRYMPDRSDPAGISDRIVWNICIDHNNYLWLANFPSGMDLFDPRKGIIRRFRYNPLKPEQMPDRVLLIQQDNENNIWICASNGLFRYNYPEDSFLFFNRIPCNYIKSFLKDNDGNLWVGSEREGLFYCRSDGSVIKVFNTKNGFPDNQIWAIVEDNQGDIWISTNKGLCRYIKKTEQIRFYTELDGLQEGQFIEQSYMKTRDGQIFFGGTNGFNAFYPEQIKDNDYIPPVYITGFELFNKPVVPGAEGSPLKKQISETREITLSYKHSVFSFVFTAINYTNPEKNLYAYKMENFENNWNYTDATRRYATYTNLDPGKYIFRVKASNNDGIWNETGASLNITITPPFWKTWWFKTLLIILIFSALFLVYYIRLSLYRMQSEKLSIMVREKTRSLEKAKETLEQTNMVLIQQKQHIAGQNMELDKHRNKLEQLVEERTMELEQALVKAEESDKLKSSFIQNLSHEIRTPLNAILGFTNLIIDGKFDQEGKESLGHIIQSNATDLLKLINDVLDISRMDTGQLTLNYGPVNLIKLLEGIMEELRNTNANSEKKDITISVSFPEGYGGDNPLIIFNDPVRLHQIIANLGDNALKYTDKGTIEIGFKVIMEDKKKLRIFIKDTGIGIAEAHQKVIFERFRKVDDDISKLYRGLGLGLTISSRLAGMMGGRLEVASKPDRGSEFSLVLPFTETGKSEISVEKYKSENTEIVDWEQCKILVVDDEISNLSYMEHVLKPTGAKTISVSNGYAAIDIYRKEWPDIVLLDIKMDGMDGVQTMRSIRDFNKDSVIIAQTAYSAADEQNELLKEGFNKVLTKPYSRTELLETIRSFLTARPRS